jgi:hypothetical protein
MLGAIIIILNLFLLFVTYNYYRRFHKLSTTLLLIVLLSLLFKNSALIISDTEKSSVIYKAGMATFILFSFSILIAIIQAGTLSVKYMYLTKVRKLAWGVSFILMLFWFFLNQIDIVTSSIFVNYLLNNIIELLIVSIVTLIGFYAWRNKNYRRLFYGGILYFVILIVLYYLEMKSIKSFAISQTVFVVFLVISEIESIKKGKIELKLQSL